jgi:MFS transporter, PAT family, beta-lactamase induction signal transducer AmpG
MLFLSPPTHIDRAGQAVVRGIVALHGCAPRALAYPRDRRRNARGQSDTVSLDPTMSPASAAPAHKAAHPFLFLVLFIPFGAVPGFLTVALAYELKKKGIDTGDIAIVVGLSYVCLLLKWLWAPLVDTLFTRKIWYIGSTLLCGLGFWLAGRAAMGQHPSLVLVSAWLTLSNFTATLLAMAVESLMAATIPDGKRGSAGGWSQAGNLGGQGLGGGLALWLVESRGFTEAQSGAALGLVCALCCLALRWVDDTRPLLKVQGHVEAAGHLGVVANLKAIGSDLWELLRSRIGILALMICLLPIGSGAAQNLWSPIAGEWHASADVVAFVTGAMSGIISAFGCLAGGWLCDRMDRKMAYCLFGFLLAVVAVGMAVCPRTAGQYTFWTSAYAFVVGLCYAAYCAVVLEAIGRTAAATKFSFLSAVSNTPIMVMTFIDGAANTRWGTNGMLWTDAWCGVIGIVVFALVAGATRRKPAAAPLASAS